MHKAKYSGVFIFALLMLNASFCLALQLEVSKVKSFPGREVTVNITVSDYNQENIAGTVFTLTYNSTFLTLRNISSNHFGNFLNQWSLVDPAPDPLPDTSVTVGGITYTRPLAHAVGTSQVMVAAARIKGGQPAVLMTFTFMINDVAGISDNVIPLSIQPSVVSDTSAGYKASGEQVPILYGMVEGETDPALAYPAYSPATVSGYIDATETFQDDDEDGMDDSWEIRYFADTETADALTDFDGDHYTDLQEFLNSVANLTDPNGADFVPNVANAAGGVGYNNPNTSKAFWNLMLPVLIHQHEKKQPQKNSP
ncbi:cohesin domain-containing protein [Desulfogranum japonicum]|uniref:cohesin domain-containing protein n=1 Tax=Desulfogranum japonicum TaxID=231447 RepID=UPI000403FC9C|nr:cohesin domain-containing protein [Desulfogranum japonicum]